MGDEVDKPGADGAGGDGLRLAYRMNQTTDDRQAVQAYIESMLKDFENEHPGTAEALRLHEDAMKHYLPATRALAKPVFRVTAANSKMCHQRD